MSAASYHDELHDTLVGRRLGRYDVLHRVAAGGMGRVYIGRVHGMAGFERLVAIKVLHPQLAHEPSFVSMFLDEARLAARIRHPNVVPTLDVSQSDEAYFLVMDYVEGDNLGRVLAKAVQLGARPSTAILVRIMLDALSGLHAAHELCDAQGDPLNLVHRDVSPQNILVGRDGVARLTDFGVAKAELRVSSTRSGEFKGKLAYTSPEQASQEPVDRRADIFAMGIVFWESLTGKRLFQADTNVGTLRRLLDEPIVAPSCIDPELAPFDAVVLRALSRNVDGRFSTAREMALAIEAVAKDHGGVATSHDVSELVTRVAAEKLAREAAAVNSAVSNSAIRVKDGRGEADEEPTVSAKLTTHARRHVRRRNTRSLVVGSLLGLVGVAVVLLLARPLPTPRTTPRRATTQISNGTPKVPTSPADVAPVVPTAHVPAVELPSALVDAGVAGTPAVKRATKPRAPLRRVAKAPSNTRTPEVDVLDNPYRQR